MNTNLPMNYSFGKKIWAELVNLGGAAGEWLITDEFSTDLDEIGIFVLSKAQTFRICATFLDPAKFSILVIHLLINLNFAVRPEEVWVRSLSWVFFSFILFFITFINFPSAVEMSRSIQNFNTITFFFVRDIQCFLILKKPFQNFFS